LVTLARKVLGLQKSITMDVAFPNRTTEDDPITSNRWGFNPTRMASITGLTLPKCTFETATGQSFRLAKQIYDAEGSDEAYVPTLYTKKTKRIVANESAEIIRMLNAQTSALDSSIADRSRSDLYPLGDQNITLRRDIDTLNDQIYVGINNGVYNAGFSTDQAVYAAAFINYFETLGA
jgi:putative glutathione S-transferase